MFFKISLGRPVRFVDLGCGNGFLTFLLNDNGHEGIGLDRARRKIWSLYGRHCAALREEVVVLSEASYPFAEWLIGDHKIKTLQR
jgi:SAM-dependent methyltransferase